MSCSRSKWWVVTRVPLNYSVILTSLIAGLLLIEDPGVILEDLDDPQPNL